ncbi:MAG TPA: histidine kinase, partial [Chitinophagaceae bacterium]|nr:histidine kinase [Chitinophagaceae bacterium]
MVDDNVQFVATFRVAHVLSFIKAYFSAMMRRPIPRKYVLIILHISFWLLLIGLPQLLRQPFEGNKPHAQTFANKGFETHNAFSFVSLIGLFYLNAFLFMPRLYFQKKYKAYFMAVGAVILLLSFLNWLSFTLLVNDFTFHFRLFILGYLFPCLFFLVISASLAMFQDRAKIERLTKERETENLKTELLFLRSQVSPHFLFNVLNNMVALARKSSDQLEPSLIKLASLLRYMLYEAAEEKVPLEKEVDYLKSYIDLQTQRFRKNMTVNLEIKPFDAPYEIEPMLLIPFVENAFKHGVTLEPEATIDIELSTTKGLLQLLVRNRFIEEDAAVKDKASGIGLTNVMRRLNLLYKDHHTLLINKSNGW